MAVEIGALRALLSLDSAAFEKGTKRAQASMSNLQRSLDKTARIVGAAAKKIALGLVAVGTAAGVGAVAASRSMTELANRARLAGISAREFKIAALAAKGFGVEEDKLADILKDVNDKFGDFLATGQGPLVDFFENIAPKVGLTREAFEGLSSSDALALYVKALEQAGASQQEMTFYMEALASDATALVPVFSNNAAALSDLSARADELGLTLEDGAIAAAQAARSEFSLVAEVFKTNFQAALVEILPHITRLAEVALPAIKVAIAAIGTAVEVLVLLFEGDFRGALSIVSEVVQGIVDKVMGLASDLIDAGKAAIQGFVDGMLEKWRELKASVASIFDLSSIFGGESASTATRREGRRIGGEAAAGMAEGLQSGAVSVGRASAAAAQRATDAAKEQLDIQSPSRVFMEIGAQMMSGLGLGIQTNTQIATDAIRDGVAEMSTSLDGLGDKSGQVADRFAGMVAGIIEGTQSIGDVAKQLGSSLLNAGLSGLFNASGLGNIFSGLFPGFEGGGFTGFGARSGGLDGRGGFPAILHPNETVIDHTRGARVSASPQAMAVTITMDESTGAMGAFVRDQAGRVVAQAAPRIMSGAVDATYRRAREVPIGRR